MIDILLVEDNPGDVRLTQEAFKDTTVANTLHVVKDGVAALDFLYRRGVYQRAPRPDLILLDLDLPKKNGREVLEQVKQADHLKTIPVVIMTTSQAPDEVLWAYSLHANCYITKPVEFIEFARIVKVIEDFWLTVVTLPSNHAMKPSPIKILLIEDNPGDARLLEHMLAQAPGLFFELAWADNLTRGIAHLKTKRTDIVLLDLGLPESTGLDTVQRVVAAVSEVPTLVVLSGLSDEEIAVQAVQSGAQDYLVKGQVDASLLLRSIRYAMERSQAKRALRQAHDELEQRVAERTGELAKTINALQKEIAERKQAEEQIRLMAHYDALTGLPNRVLMQDRINQAIAYAHRTQGRMAILFIDLDYFKNINDSLGHHIGDKLLQMAAVRLQLCRREEDSVARLGGDEFVLSLPLLNDSRDAARVAQQALDTLSQPFTVEGHQLHVSCSVGISVYPDDGTDVETLMRTADTAMYHAKEMGRGNFQFFTASLNQAVQQRLIVGTRLRQALAHDEFVLHYQPQVDMASGRIFSAEALLRWQQAGTEPISCGAFIANAEESGLIVPIGEWALRQACKQLKAWRDGGHPDFRMAVNLSPRQLEQTDFCMLVGDILDESGLPANALELEITEGTLMRRSEFNLAALKRLCEMGILLSVDDFGTGYSSLAYLQRYPIGALKIDQSFVHNIGTDPNDSALITAIIAMAASLRLQIIAEGVETSQQAQFLLSHDCPAAQGFYYSKALPPELFASVLDKWNESANSGSGPRRLALSDRA